MYLILTEEKPNGYTISKTVGELRKKGSIHSYDGESTARMEQYLKEEDNETAIVSADSRFLLFALSIFPLDDIYIYRNDKLIALKDSTRRILRPTHNFFKMYEAGEFTELAPEPEEDSSEETSTVDLSVKEWIEKFKTGEFASPTRSVQMKAGWYDWHCGDSRLLKKTNRMGKVLSKIENEYLLNNMGLYFKNYFPTAFEPYDTLNLFDLKTKECLYSIWFMKEGKEIYYRVVSPLEGEELDEEKEVLEWLNAQKPTPAE